MTLSSPPAGPLLELAQPGFPERLAFLEHGAERTVVQVDLEPGGGPPMHVHRHYAEHFEVLSGELDVELDGRVTRLRAGERCTAPARSAHRFTNSTDAPVRFVVTIEPGQPGFLDMQLIFFGLRADGLVDDEGAPSDPRHAAVALGRSDTAPPGFGALVLRVFRLIARLTGEERRLHQRYVAGRLDRRD